MLERTDPALLEKKAILYRMVMPGHTCPYGLNAKDLLRREGYEVEDHHLTTREETDGACRNHFWRQLSPSQGRYFHALLTFCSPKRRASKSFWSLTVQPPEKPKPFRSHSIASKPAMVRRAVLKDWKPPIFGMFFFTRKWSLSIPCWRCLVT